MQNDLLAQQELSRGVHSLEEVLSLAARNFRRRKEDAGGTCPKCGRPLRLSWFWQGDWRGDLICDKCGVITSF